MLGQTDSNLNKNIPFKDGQYTFFMETNTFKKIQFEIKKIKFEESYAAISVEN